MKMSRTVEGKAKKRVERLERLKYWDVCNGDCSHCWPKVYQACKSSKKRNRLLHELEVIARQEEAQEVLDFYNKKIQQNDLITLEGES